MATQLALAYPEIGFTLMSGPRQLLRCTPTSGLEDRFYQLYGERPDLVPVAKEAGGLRIRGYVAALADQGPTRGAQQYFVNGRIVKDRTIAHAVIDAYAAATARERSPEAHLFIEMPPDAVDVNVHPTKAEVRFRQQSLVHEVVRRAVQDAIGGGGAPGAEAGAAGWSRRRRGQRRAAELAVRLAARSGLERAGAGGRRSGCPPCSRPRWPACPGRQRSRAQSLPDRWRTSP